MEHEKKQTVQTIMTIVVTALIFIVGLTAVALSNRDEFDGNKTKNPDSYILEIEKMNGTDEHTLSLKSGDKLAVEFVTEKGSLEMKITSPSGEIIYEGNGTEATNFTLTVNEDGNYVVFVKATNAKGKIGVKKAS